jgi:uncharacterized protein (TIRG00374 family)
MNLKNKISPKILFNIIKIIVSTLTVVYLIRILNKEPYLQHEVYDHLLHFFSTSTNLNFLWITIALMPLNLGLEALKWKLLASKVEKLSFFLALKGIFAGQTLSLITPQNTGDFVARIYFLKTKHKAEATGAVLVAGITQFYISVFFGIIAFFLTIKFQYFVTGFFNIFTIITFGFLCLTSLFFLFNFQILYQFLQKYSWSQKLSNYLRVINDYNLNDFIQVFAISLLRFWVFTLQYIFLLQLFGIKAFDILNIAAIWLIFFIKSIFPTLNFINDLGVREASALYFFGNLGLPSSSVLLASLMLWLINLFVPTLIGLLIILFHKIEYYNQK